MTSLAERARRCLGAALARADDDISHLRARLLALAPSATLRRGYAIVQRADGAVIRQAAGVPAGESSTLRGSPDDQRHAARAELRLAATGSRRPHQGRRRHRQTGLRRARRPGTQAVRASIRRHQDVGDHGAC